jgi:glycosyltransferase involved in cell wall biosynthesis
LTWLQNSKFVLLAISCKIQVIDKAKAMKQRVPPKVSVCIPVYNGSAYIGESIESVLAQTYKHFELIICDNCSTDDTENIVCSFKDPRVTYVKNDHNIGLVANANHCLDLASGEYVCIFHHDDIMLPKNLEHKVRLLDDHPDVGFVHSNIMLIDSKGELVSSNIWAKDSTRDYIEEGMSVFQRFVHYLPFGSSIFIGAVLARRACYAHLGRFSLELPHCNDSEMWMRMLLFYNVACIGTPLVKYRVHAISTSAIWGNWTSAPYIKEHHLAVTMVLGSYKEKIVDAHVLKRQMSLAFCKQALRWACNYLGAGDFASGRELFKEAVKMSPRFYQTIYFWKTAAKLAVGPSAVRLYQVGKKHVARIIHASL